jgi:hypothetical protein
MLKLASMIFTMLSTTLAGSFVLVVVTLPRLADQGMTFIPIAAAAGFILAVPLSYVIAKRILAMQKTPSASA